MTKEKALYLLLFTLVLLGTGSGSNKAFSQEDAVIDGYELPDMFDEDTSTPIAPQSSGTKEKVTKPAQQFDEYEPAFKPITQVKKTPKKLNKLPVQISERPKPRPEREQQALLVQENSREQLIEAITTDILRPTKRPISRKLAKAKKSNELAMPAVPPVDVMAAPLAAPEPVMDISINSHPEIKQNLNQDVSFITVDIETESTKQEDAEIIDVSASTVPIEQEATIEPDTEKNIILQFQQAELDINDNAKAIVDNVILPKLQNNSLQRLEVLSYAEAIDDTTSSARRASLARALALRSYLMTKKIESQRIDIRALGDETDILPKDRIELNLIN